jgi:hypothetical protein
MKKYLHLMISLWAKIDLLDPEIGRQRRLSGICEAVNQVRISKL